jgi:hypothetical protein
MRPLSLLAAIWLSLSASLAFGFEDGVIGVRLSDLERHAAGRVQAAGRLNQTIENESTQFFLTGKDVEKVLMSFLDDRPQVQGNSTIYQVTSFVQYTSGELVFERMSVSLNRNSGQFSINLVDSIDLQDTDFRVEVGLVDRVAHVFDARRGLRMVFPLGVGSFDEGILNEEYSLLTPRFKNGFLSKRVAIESRTSPRYFAGKPFIRILDGDQKAHTAIGFHAQPNLAPFIRAFDSHGCIRMQLDDLELFYLFVAHNPKQYIPITVNYRLAQTIEHPFPKRNRTFQTVQNVGTAREPMYTIDRDYLVQTHAVGREAPVHRLIDHSWDNNEEVFKYSSEPCRIKSFGNEPRSGWPASLTSNIAWERCEARNRRNRLYRMWVHR